MVVTAEIRVERESLMLWTGVHLGADNSQDCRLVPYHRELKVCCQPLPPWRWPDWRARLPLQAVPHLGNACTILRVSPQQILVDLRLIEASAMGPKANFGHPLAP